MPKNKRGNTDLNFLIGINKPAGMTSHDVVNKIRNITGEGRVGHMGTLDPFATGVLLIGVGSAARLNSYLENHDKTNIATSDFGKNTNTYDSEGEVTQTFDTDDRIYDKDFANEYLAKIVGKQMQVPPAYSAIKMDGKAAYKSARKGNSPKLEPREIEIFSAKLMSIHDNS
ncbi:MAG: hypothetical protein MJ060_04695 [Clostridia bacterium]|nr:hypothetical protein [Clostridia bacterium]